MRKSIRCTVSAQATHDGSGDVIVDLPAALLEEMGLAIGDDLEIAVAGDTIILTPIRDLEHESLRVPDLKRAQANATYQGRMTVLLGIPDDATVQHIHNMIEGGLEVSAITPLRELALVSLGSLDALVPAHTLKAKLASGARLSSSESDCLFRLAHTIALAELFFGDTEKAMRWLSKPKSRFSGKTPIEMLSTTAGSHLVEELFTQATEGLSL
ncbi:antitoxin Xre/MbcA/ParS toxin-binding domain-containing protein [Pseudomonas sp. MDT1-16]